jgi:phosphotransferase family enzyme
MYRVDGANEPHLLVVKDHDPDGRRVTREFEVLSILGDTISPKAILLDRDCDIFPGPVLVTTFVEPVPIEPWDDGNLDRLARLMATIHTDRRLMNLDVDRDCPAHYSVSRELADETRDLASFRRSPLKNELMRIHDVLRAHIDRWEELFQGGAVVYVHGDLPHHHVFASNRHWWTIHWEWSRQSHPTRELARAYWDLEMPPDREMFLLERYSAYVPHGIGPEALEVQRLLQYFYNAIHVAFWLDRATDFSHPDWEKATAMSKVVRLWVEMGARRLNG